MKRGNGMSRDEQQAPLTRREFTKAAGATALFAGATDPAAADDLRGTDRVDGVGAASLAAIEEPFTPDRWLTVGPFQYQRRDVEVGWLFPGGDESAYGSGEQTPGDERFPSAFAGGSDIEWHAVDLDDGESTVPFRAAAEEIDPTGGELTPLYGGPGLFDDVQDWYGLGGMLYGAGYAFATFEVDEPLRAVLETDASDVWLNGHRYDETPAGVVLQEGTNFLLAKGNLTLGAGSVSLTLRPPEAPVEVNDLAAFRGTPQNAVVPDLKVGERTDLPASVRVTNTTARELDEVTLTFAPDGDALVPQEVEVDPPLAPFETRRIETRVKTKGKVAPETAEGATVRSTSTEVPEASMTHTALAGELDDAGIQAQGDETATFGAEANAVGVRAAVTADGETHGRDVPLRVRGEDESRRQLTFTSGHDDSVQTFSVREPANLDSSDGPYDLIFTLHGANVPSINQAGAYTPREDTYVVAPGARGPVNYDHEDLGRLDDLEALRVARERFEIDDDRGFLTGHSMGGHGTWHLGLTHPDRFAAIGPSAGWTDHETYLTSTFGRDKLHTFPRLKAVKETALQKNLAMPKAANAADGTLPAFVLHGGQDTSVPTVLPRSYVRALANEGLSVDGQVGERHDNADPGATDVAYLEVPGAGHWWDEGITEGNDGVNHPDMLSFLAANTRDPYPGRVVFFTTNLRIEHGKHWVAVLEQETVHAPTRVEAEVTSEGVVVETENVARLALDARVLKETAKGASKQVVVGNDSARLPGNQWVTVDLTEGLDVRPGQRTREGVKGPDQYGPLQEVHHDPYRLVYGTRGSAAETALNRNLANLRSGRLASRARAPAPVVPDTAVDRRMTADYNLVLFGRPSTNGVLSDLQGSFPVAVRDGSVSVGGETYRGDLGVEFVYPHPEHSERLVQVESGTTPEGLRLTGARNWIPTQVGTPDYHVYDRTIRYQRWNASQAAGFFDEEWRVDHELGFLRSFEG